MLGNKEGGRQWREFSLLSADLPGEPSEEVLHLIQEL